MIFNLIILFLGTIAAFWISAICGGGASLIVIPILNLMIPSSLVPFSLTIGTFTSSVSRIAVFKKKIRWKIFWWFAPFSIPAVLLGAWLIKYINPNYLQIIVAFFLLLNLPELFKSKNKTSENNTGIPTYNLAIIGILAGFISGITGAIGLLFNRFYLKLGLDKEEIIATRAANEVFLHLIKLIIYISLGLYSGTALWLGIAIALASIVSSYTVKYILPYLSEFLFKKIGYAAMVLSGLILLVSTSQKIITTDQVSISFLNRGKKVESHISWRDHQIALEFALHEGIELEKTILPNELPHYAKTRFLELEPHYDRIHIEKVLSLSDEPSYEFNCYKLGQKTKFTIT
ncbi:MAG: sulfite exporter TauE/SafE family protein [Chryseobacterium sp.]|nr:sulfite exporter TauE/SafE family protein [Candidatus Chryseobacterium enterohippi]